MSEATERIGQAGPRRFRPYHEYKDSGVEWLGEIPADWDVTVLKRLAALRAGAAITSESIEPQGEYPVFGGNGIRGYTDAFTHEGEFPLIGRQGALCGCVNFASGRFWASEHAVVAAPVETVNPHWLAQLLEAMSLNAYAESAAQPGIAVDTIGVIRAPAPGTAEQRTIAAFLDRETERIDALVAKKERLIELLHERRTSLIARAVTKGLDPDVPLKDSGVEWLGEIPAHWVIGPVYARYEVALGKMLDAKRDTGEYSGPYLRNVDVQWDAVNVEALPEMDFLHQERDRYRLRPGDILVCEGGEVGRTAIWRGELKECFYQKAIHRVRPRSASEEPRFFYFLMLTMATRGVFTAGGNPNTIDHLTAVQLRHYRIPFPSRTEQRAIAVFLDQETAQIDALVTKVRDAIDRLKELRTALISAAVTGKIDVREEVT